MTDVDLVAEPVDNRDFYYSLALFDVETSSIHFRYKFCLIKKEDCKDLDSVVLCWQCREALCSSNGRQLKSEFTWPSFIYAVITNRGLINKYKDMLWKTIPSAWRGWWLHIVSCYLDMQGVTLESPAPCCREISQEMD